MKKHKYMYAKGSMPAYCDSNGKINPDKYILPKNSKSTKKRIRKDHNIIQSVKTKKEQELESLKRTKRGYFIHLDKNSEKILFDNR